MGHPAQLRTLAPLRAFTRRLLLAQDRDSKQMLKVLDMMERRSLRLVLSITDLREWNRDRAQQLISNPLVFLPILEGAVRDVSGPVG